MDEPILEVKVDVGQNGNSAANMPSTGVHEAAFNSGVDETRRLLSERKTAYDLRSASSLRPTTLNSFRQKSESGLLFTPYNDFRPSSFAAQSSVHSSFILGGKQPLAPRIRKPGMNPFSYDYHWDTYERIKTIVMCVLLIPVIRLVIIIKLFILATLGHSYVDPETGQSRPLGKTRKLIASPVPWLARAMLFVLGYYWIPVREHEGAQPRAARILVANHVTFVDALIVVYRHFASVAMKVELARVPLLGRIMRIVDPIFVDRHTPEGRKKAGEDMKNRPRQLEWPPLFIFPEGTCSRPDCLTKFKKGAFIAGEPVQPMILHYSYRQCDVSWTPMVKSWYVMGRMLCQFVNYASVEYPPLYVPNGTEREDPDIYAENVRRSMADIMKVPTTDHAFEDVLLLVQLGSYADDVLRQTDLQEVRKLTNLSVKEAINLAKRFQSMDVDKSGSLSKDELIEAFGLQSTSFASRLFDLLDADGNGEVAFREVCLGLSFMSPNFQRSDAVRFAFSLFDLDGNGQISEDELRQALKHIRRIAGLEENLVDAVMESAFQKGAQSSKKYVTHREFADLTDRYPELIDKVFGSLKPLAAATPHLPI